MTTRRIIKFLLTGSCSIILAACAHGGALPESVAAAKAMPTAQNAGGLLTIANDMAAKGDHEAAIPLYRHLSKTTRAPAAITGLANSMLAIGNLEAAHKLLTELIAQEGEYATGETFYSYGKASLALGLFDLAITGFREAETRAPNDARARSGRAIALAALGDPDAAITAFGAATDPSSLSNKALILAASGKPETAVNILEPVIIAGNSQARDRQNLAMAYLMAGREEQARKIARLDLDTASIDETFLFYRSLNSLNTAERMQALVTGVINPEWTTEEQANLVLENSSTQQMAASRLITPVIKPEPKIVTATPEPEPAIKTVVAEKYDESQIPPLLEPEGWALQIGAYRSIKRLTRGWAILYERNIDILSDIPPRRSEVDFGTRNGGPSGFYFRLNAGPLATYKEAKTLCDELISRGTSCWIRPPEKSEGMLPAQALSDN